MFGLFEQNSANYIYKSGSRSSILGGIIWGSDSLDFIWNLKKNMNKHHLNK